MTTIEAGKVTSISGKYLAVSEDGSERVLKVGDTVYEGEVIKADGGTKLEITNGDNVFTANDYSEFIITDGSCVVLQDSSSIIEDKVFDKFATSEQELITEKVVATAETVKELTTNPIKTW